MEDISTQFLNYLISQQNSDISTDFFPENDELINILQDYFLMLYQIQNQKYVGTFCNLQNCIQFVQKETYYKLLKQKEDENEQSQNTNNQNEDNKKFTNFPLKELSSMLNDKDKEKIDLKNIFKQCIKYSQQNHAENPFEIESIEPNFTKVIQANKHNEQLDKNPYSVKEGYLNREKKIDFSKENVIDLTDDTYQRKQDDDRRYNQQQIYNQKNMSYDFKQQDKRHFVNQQHQNREMIIIDGESNKNHYSNNRPNKIQDSRPVSPNRRSQERKNLRDDYFDQKHHSIKQDNNRQLSSSQYNSINNLRERDRSYNNKGSEEHRKQLNNIQNNKFQNNQKQYQNNQGYNNYSNKYNFNNGRYQDYRYNRRLSSERGERRSQSRYREEDTPLRSRPKGNDWESNYQKKKSVSSSSSSSSQSSSRSVQRSNNKRSQDQSYLRRNSNQFSVSPQHKNSQSPQIRNRNQSDSQSKLSIHSNQRISEQKLLYHQNGNKSVNIPQIAAKTIGNNNQTQQFKQLQQNKFIGQKLNSNSNINIDGNGYNSPEKQINNYKPFKNSPVRSNQDKFQFQTSTRNKPQENFQFNFQIPSHIKPPSQIINPVIQQNGLQQFPNNIAQTPTNTIDNQHEIKSVIQQQVFPPQPQQDQKFQNFLMFNPYSNIQQIPQKSNQTFNPFYGQSNLLTKGLEKQQSNN